MAADVCRAPARLVRQDPSIDLLGALLNASPVWNAVGAELGVANMELWGSLCVESMKSKELSQLRYLSILPGPKGTHGFQCSLEILYRLPNMIGRTLSTFSSTRLRMYSLFQKYRALSATYQNREETQLMWRSLTHNRLAIVPSFQQSHQNYLMTSSFQSQIMHMWSKRLWITRYSSFLVLVLPLFSSVLWY